MAYACARILTQPRLDLDLIARLVYLPVVARVDKLAVADGRGVMELATPIVENGEAIKSTRGIVGREGILEASSRLLPAIRNVGGHPGSPT